MRRGSDNFLSMSTSLPLRSFKVILLGESNVGKTCLILRFCDNTFSKQNVTVGCDLKMKTVVVDDEPIKLVIWDTDGEERLRSITTQFYRGCQAAIFVYDITNILSFKTLNYWLDECQQHGITTDKIPCILVGNKSDCINDVAVSRNMAKNFAERFGLIEFFETSAAADSKYSTVNNIFMVLAHKLKRTVPLPLQSNDGASSIRLQKSNESESRKKKKSGSAFGDLPIVSKINF